MRKQPSRLYIYSVTVLASWTSEDFLAAQRQGWALGQSFQQDADRMRPYIASMGSTRHDPEAFARMLEQAMMGDPTAYKALRIVCKGNPAYKPYKPMVRLIYRRYFRAKLYTQEATREGQETVAENED